MKKLLFFALAIAGLVSCGNGKADKSANANDSDSVVVDSIVSIEGVWIQPIPGQDSVQGMNLKSDKTAESVNMNTLVYSAWDQKGDSLVLVATSIGNKNSSTDTVTYQIVSLTGDSLVLANGQDVFKYARKK